MVLRLRDSCGELVIPQGRVHTFFFCSIQVEVPDTHVETYQQSMEPRPVDQLAYIPIFIYRVLHAFCPQDSHACMHLIFLI